MGMIYTLICNDGTKYVGDQTKTCANNGGTLSSSGGTVGNFDWNKGEKFDWSKVVTSPIFTGSTYQQVLCKDGTTRTQENNPNARIMDACRDNGGRAENQIIPFKPTSEIVKQQNSLKIGEKLTAEDKFYEKLGIKYHNTHMFGRPSRTKGRLLVLVVLVGGYFAYKKFKK
jgi:hypothetical protein